MLSLLKPVEVSIESVTTLLEHYNKRYLLKPVEVSIESVTTIGTLQYALSFEASRSKHRVSNHTIGALQYALSFEASRSIESQ